MRKAKRRENNVSNFTKKDAYRIQVIMRTYFPDQWEKFKKKNTGRFLVNAIIEKMQSAGINSMQDLREKANETGEKIYRVVDKIMIKSD